jgi:hypothetical protein
VLRLGIRNNSFLSIGNSYDLPSTLGLTIKDFLVSADNKHIRREIMKGE